MAVTTRSTFTRKRHAHVGVVTKQTFQNKRRKQWPILETKAVVACKANIDIDNNNNNNNNNSRKIANKSAPSSPPAITTTTTVFSNNIYDNDRYTGQDFKYTPPKSNGVEKLFAFEPILPKDGKIIVHSLILG